MDAATVPEIGAPDAAFRLHDAPAPSGRAVPAALLAALALHLAILAAVLLRAPPALPPGPPPDAIAVEIVPSGQLPSPPVPPPAAPSLAEAPPPPATAPAPPPAAGPLRHARPAPPPEPEMVRPTTMLSARRLADPRSRSARLALRSLDADTRVEQLCGLEAMEQLHSWRHDLEPDRLVAYAMGEPKALPDGIEADGAAVRSHANWYRVRFRCELSADRSRVVAFAFALGDPVPRDEWNDRSLPALH